eukprot:Selendium_serpulae@DN5144_c0_g1_i1.p1
MADLRLREVSLFLERTSSATAINAFHYDCQVFFLNVCWLIPERPTDYSRLTYFIHNQMNLIMNLIKNGSRDFLTNNFGDDRTYRSEESDQQNKRSTGTREFLRFLLLRQISNLIKNICWHSLGPIH